MGRSRTLYVIELEPKYNKHAKWYVGITDDPKRRYMEHDKGYGSLWTHQNECVGMYVLGSFVSARDARRSENQLTLALWDEYGPKTTRGGKYSADGATDEPVPDGVDTHLSPRVAEWLEETGNEELAALSDRARVYMKVRGKIPFESMEAAEEWGDRELPEGMTLELTTPEHDYGTFITEDPEDAD